MHKLNEYEAEPIDSQLDAAACMPTTGLVVNLNKTRVEKFDNPTHGDVTWRTLFSSDKTPTSDVLLGVADFTPHGVLSLHRHVPAEFYLCLSGSGVVTIDQVDHPISTGSAVFVPANAEHGVLAGARGLSIAYGFAQDSFSDIDYVFSAPTIANMN